ncbi:hypothetical protein [Nocardia salmonicida]|uniref:hypothetical protein n=1 Tax=Nocardia salmonicida TaxID=53431 RepID=UPI0036252108
MPSSATDDGVSAMRRRTYAVTSDGPLVVSKFEFHGPATTIVVLGHGVPPGGAICAAVVISSADHIERAAEALAATGIEVVGTVTPDQVPALAWNAI